MISTIRKYALSKKSDIWTQNSILLKTFAVLKEMVQYFDKNNEIAFSRKLTTSIIPSRQST